MQNKLKQGESLFAEGKIEEAEKCFLEILNEDPKNKEAYNNLGVISFQRQNFEQALEYISKVLEIDPFHKDAILNYSALLKNANRFYDSVPILEKAIKRFPDDQEISRLLNEVRQMRRSRTKIAILCLPGLQSFLGDIVDYLKTKYDVRTCYSKNNQEIGSAVQWADLVWLEWANQMAVHVTNKIPQIKDKKVICRLHGYEVFTDMPAHINWSVVDSLLFVAKHKQEIFNKKFKIQSPPQTVIRNGVNTSKFTVAKNKQNTKRLVLLGHLNFRKGLPILLHFYYQLLKHDPEYYLYIRGEFQDPRLEMAAHTMIGELSLTNKLEFVDWVDDLNAWFADKSHILSFSLEESFHYTIGNGMAAGLKPVIHAWNESREIWPEEFIFNNMESFLRLMLDDVYESERYRKLLADNGLDCGRQLRLIEDLIGDVRVTRAVPELNIKNQVREKLSVEKRRPQKSNLVTLSRKRKRNVFIVGLKRSGTTIFWKTFRQDKRFMCFDEPFHPQLFLHVTQGADNHKSTMTEYLGKREIILNHWSPILPYQEIMGKFIPHQLTYMKELLATGDNVCIDLVRCHSKIGELRKVDPDALIIHLLRDPRAFVTSHLKPYGKWVSNELPEKFFEYDGWFDYWQYQTLCNLMGFREAAHLALLRLWKAFFDVAEEQRPDMTLQFEDFATNSEDTMQLIYEMLNLDYPGFDFSCIHAPNAPFEPDTPLWTSAMEKAGISARFANDLWNQDSGISAFRTKAKGSPTQKQEEWSVKTSSSGDSFDANKYWKIRHAKLNGAIQSVGHIGRSESTNLERYVKRQIKLQKLLQTLKLDLRGKRVLEAGCGIGIMSKWLLDRGADLTGVDISEIAIKHARNRCPNGKFFVADLSQLKLNCKFDVLACIDVLYHIVDDEKWRQGLECMVDSLEIDGYMIFVDNLQVANPKTSPHVHYRSTEEYRRTMENMNMVKVAEEQFDFAPTGYVVFRHKMAVKAGN